ncbi:unnamed protein product [Sphagnum tenellum]
MHLSEMHLLLRISFLIFFFSTLEACHPAVLVPVALVEEAIHGPPGRRDPVYREYVLRVCQSGNQEACSEWLSLSCKAGDKLSCIGQLPISLTRAATQETTLIIVNEDGEGTTFLTRTVPKGIPHQNAKEYFEQIQSSCQGGDEGACDALPTMACLAGNITSCRELLPYEVTCMNEELDACRQVLRDLIDHIRSTGTTPLRAESPLMLLPTDGIETLSTTTPTEPSQYLLLKEEELRYMKGLQCSRTETKMVSDCSGGGYVTPLYELSYVELPVPVSMEDCFKMYHRLYYADPHDHHHPLVPDSVNHIRYTEAGTPTDLHSRAKCQGTPWKSPSDWIVSRALVQVEAKILIQRTTYVHGSAGVQALPHRENLPCPAQEKGCVTSRATHVWGKEEEICPFGRLGEVVGVLHVEGGREFLTSTDQSFVKIEVKDPVQYNGCSVRLLSTNKRGLFLHPLPIGNALNETRSLTKIFPIIDATLNPLAELLYQLRTDYLLWAWSRDQYPGLPTPAIRPLPAEDRVGRSLPVGQVDLLLTLLTSQLSCYRLPAK